MKSSVIALGLFSVVGTAALAACSSTPGETSGPGGSDGSTSSTASVGGGAATTGVGGAATTGVGGSTSTATTGVGGSSSTATTGVGGSTTTTTGVGGSTTTTTASSTSGATTASSSSGGAANGDCANPTADVCSPLATCTDAAGAHTCACPAGAGDPNGDGSQCVIRFDLSAVLVHDTVVNNGNNAKTDGAQNYMDGNQNGNDFGTQTYAVSAVPAGQTPNGLPDDATFAATVDHPAIKLYWSNGDDGNNCTILNYGGASAVGSAPFGLTLAPFAIAPGNYTQLQVFGTSANGPTEETITIKYETGNDDVRVTTFSDWFGNTPGDQFLLIGGLDRIAYDGSNYDDNNKPSIWGFNLAPDPTRKVTHISIAQTDNFDDHSFVFYGMSGY